MSTVGARGWWSWPQAGLGFALPVMGYALWGLYLYAEQRRISAKSTGGPDDGGTVYLFFMLVLTVVVLLALLIVSSVLCAFRGARSFGLGMMIAALLPLMLGVMAYWGLVVHLRGVAVD